MFKHFSDWLEHCWNTSQIGWNIVQILVKLVGTVFEHFSNQFKHCSNTFQISSNTVQTLFRSVGTVFEHFSDWLEHCWNTSQIGWNIVQTLVKLAGTVFEHFQIGSNTVQTPTTMCQELNYSGATLDSFPALLRPTFLHYSGVHSHATPVHTPVLLQSTTGLDQTPLDLPFRPDSHLT